MTATVERPAAPAPAPGGVCRLLAPVLRGVFGGPPPIGVRAWDGSTLGPLDGPVLVLRTRDALRRLLWNPGELGLARAYVTGEIDVEGDLAEGFRRIRLMGSGARPSPATAAHALRALLAVRAVGRPLPAPRSEARLKGRLHTPARDRAAIAHHYDFSNDFYALLLDSRMAYSCAYYTRPDAGLEEAQAAKLDLVCRKLALRPGMRFLDVGCGWGALAVHAAREYGARVTGVTLSREQAALARERAAGLPVEIRVQDYRAVDDGPYDAVSSIEMGEHVGEGNYPVFASALHRLVRPRGRVLVQQMSRGAHAPGGGAFIERYIAPDMHMRPVGDTVALLEQAGLEVVDVHALREHYVRTVADWSATFDSRRDEIAALVGEEAARVWRLYLVGGASAFEQGRMGVDQILMVRPDGAGASGLPLAREALLQGKPVPGEGTGEGPS
ncbi:SAM-dependent methyltransferase [Actinomadura parmotrematis]|uniref:Cyclopropane-fatty-acyl-phospholipid synthase family protein n=1 Tax=Actinomadura parmotrematis TaxID=2864039 RepID=A0ABS7FZC7_9ACTN|nr:cyclopropane-fatty-acyl-phospholipid synthase family protein [Actinomadura parmotrematis]MBW8485500.1 cyclopropane-fatty-acyl-phospholipid synthase family protein [Actinomadura parmotrematis]